MTFRDAIENACVHEVFSKYLGTLLANPSGSEGKNACVVLSFATFAKRIIAFCDIENASVCAISHICTQSHGFEINRKFVKITPIRSIQPSANSDDPRRCFRRPTLNGEWDGVVKNVSNNEDFGARRSTLGFAARIESVLDGSMPCPEQLG